MTTETLLLFLIIVALVIFIYRLLLRLQALNTRVAQLEEKSRSQQVSINGLTAGAIGVDSRLRGMEDRESALEHRQESIENQQSQNEAPFGEAIRLVQQGASVQRLVEELGISESEAGLIHMIHGGKD